MVSILLAAVILSAAEPGGFELGLIIGEPTGISGKLWFDASTAFDAAVSWSLKENRKNDLYLHGDFLWHNYELIKDDSGLVPIYYGIGGRLILAEKNRLGARVPIGISWLLASAPIDLFVELAGVLDLVPDTDFDVNGGIGIRYVF